MIATLRAGGNLAAGVDHERYRHEVSTVPDATRSALLADFA